MSDKIDVKFGSLFPWPFRFIAVVVLLVGLSLILEKTFLSIGLMLIGGFILSGCEGTIINRAEKSYVDYKSFFFMKSGDKKKYSGIEKIFVSTSKTKQHLYTAHTNHSSTYEHLEFNGFLKFHGGEKIQLLRNRKKSDLIKGLEKVAKFLNVAIEDNTGVGAS
jgi:hypothetical protein